MTSLRAGFKTVKSVRDAVFPATQTHSHSPSVSRQRAHSSGRALAVVPPSPVMRRSSDPQLSPTAPSPPHASHSPQPSPAHQSRPSETAGSYCELRPSPVLPPKPPTKSYVERLRVEEAGRAGGGSVRVEGEGNFSAPQVETASSFRPSRWVQQLEPLHPQVGQILCLSDSCLTGHRFESSLLPAENKPLEMSVLKRVKELLAEADARVAARHITLVDCTVDTHHTTSPHSF